MQLQRNQADFERAGFSIIALTYDSPALQAAFIEANGIEYPMLSDVAARSVQALGILNVDYVPGMITTASRTPESLFWMRL